MFAGLVEFTCQLCNQLLFKPKDLPCSHRFCCDCLKAHCLENGNGNRFPCPACQKEVKIEAIEIPLLELPDQIPTNQVKERQLEKFHIIKKKKEVNLCVFCFSKWRTTTATKFCRTCEEYFCNECGNQHWLLRSSKAHRVWLLDDINELKVDPFVRANLSLLFNTRVKPTSKLKDSNLVDMEKCHVTGASFLPEGQLAVLDSANEKIKLFSKSFVLRSQATIQGHDLLVVSKSLIVVTCPDLNRLALFSIVKDSLKRENIVETEEKCYGLSFSDNSSFFTATAGSGVSVVKYQQSTSLDRIEISSGKLPFTCPHYIAFSVKNQTFCLTDLSNKIIKNVSNTGDVLWERKIDDCGAVTSFADYFLLCRQDRNTVDVIRPDGQILKSLLTTKDGLCKVTVASVDSWKADLNAVRIAVIDNTDLIYIYMVEDPLSQIDWYPFSRGSKLNRLDSRRSTAKTISSLCEIL